MTHSRLIRSKRARPPGRSAAATPRSTFASSASDSRYPNELNMLITASKRPSKPSERMAPRPAAEVEQALARIQRQRPLDEAGLMLRALGAQLVAVDVEIAVAEKALVPGRIAHRHPSLADGPCVYTG